jgi:hypothetical protein
VSIAVRAALGAGRRRILRQLACESLLLSLLGGAVGLVVAVVGVDLLLALAPRALAGLESVKLDAPLCAFTVAASTVVGLLVALVPARQAVRADLASALRGGAGGGTPRARTRTRRALVIVEVAACLLLLLAGGWSCAASAACSTSIPASAPRRGHDRAHPAEEPLPRPHDPRGLRATRGGRDRRRARRRRRGADRERPFSRDTVYSFEIVGREPDPPGKEPSANPLRGDARLFPHDGHQLLAGRIFDARDGREGRVIIVNDKLARRFFPGGNAVGQRMKIFDERALEIVGVVADVRQYGLAEDAPLQCTSRSSSTRSAGSSSSCAPPESPASAVAGIRARVAAIDESWRSPVCGRWRRWSPSRWAHAASPSACSASSPRCPWRSP